MAEEVEVQGGRHGGGPVSCRNRIVRLLNRLKDNGETITIIVQSGGACGSQGVDCCCAHTGCLCEVDECFAVLITSGTPCSKTYIPIDRICAIICPARTTQSGGHGGHGGGRHGRDGDWE